MPAFGTLEVGSTSLFLGPFLDGSFVVDAGVFSSGAFDVSVFLASSGSDLGGTFLGRVGLTTVSNGQLKLPVRRRVSQSFFVRFTLAAAIATELICSVEVNPPSSGKGKFAANNVGVIQ